MGWCDSCKGNGSCSGRGTMKCRQLRAGPSTHSSVWVVQHSSRARKPRWKQGPFPGSQSEEVPCADANRQETQGRDHWFLFSRCFMSFSPTFLPTTTPWESRQPGFSRRLEAAQSVGLGLWFKALTVTTGSSTCISWLCQYCPLLVGR